MRKIAVLSLLVMFVAQGCSTNSRNASAGMSAEGGLAQNYAAVAPDMDQGAYAKSRSLEDNTGMSMSGKPGAAGSTAAPLPAMLPSKVIYNGTVDVVTKDFPKTEQALLRIVKTRGAILSTSSLSGTAPSRVASWKIRVSSEQFQDLVRDVMAIGEIRNVNSTAQDVTEEFYDLESRLASKRVEEKRLTRHLVESTGNLRQILEVEHEIARVHEELETMQGRLRMLGSLTSMSTLVVSAQEMMDYVPPPVAAVAAPGFGARLGATLGTSLHSLGETGEVILHVAIALLPWVTVLAMMMAAAWILGRRALALAARLAKASGMGKRFQGA